MSYAFAYIEKYVKEFTVNYFTNIPCGTDKRDVYTSWINTITMHIKSWKQQHFNVSISKALHLDRDSNPRSCVPNARILTAKPHSRGVNFSSHLWMIFRTQQDIRAAQEVHVVHNQKFRAHRHTSKKAFFEWWKTLLVFLFFVELFWANMYMRYNDAALLRKRNSNFFEHFWKRSTVIITCIS
jgi:hypothetical protein